MRETTAQRTSHSWWEREESKVPGWAGPESQDQSKNQRSGEGRSQVGLSCCHKVQTSGWEAGKEPEESEARSQEWAPGVWALQSGDHISAVTHCLRKPLSLALSVAISHTVTESCPLTGVRWSPWRKKEKREPDQMLFLSLCGGSKSKQGPSSDFFCYSSYPRLCALFLGNGV